MSWWTQDTNPSLCWFAENTPNDFLLRLLLFNWPTLDLLKFYLPVNATASRLVSLHITLFYMYYVCTKCLNAAVLCQQKNSWWGSCWIIHYFLCSPNALTFVSQVMQHACSLFVSCCCFPSWVLLHCIAGPCRLLALTIRSFICTIEIILLSLLNEPITVEAEGSVWCTEVKMGSRGVSLHACVYVH